MYGGPTAWAEEQYCGLDGLPTDLSVKAGICLLNMGRLDEAKQAFDELLEEGVDGYPDLFIKVADAYTYAPHHPSPPSFLLPAAGSARASPVDVPDSPQTAHVGFNEYRHTRSSWGRRIPLSRHTLLLTPPWAMERGGWGRRRWQHAGRA